MVLQGVLKLDSKNPHFWQRQPEVGHARVLNKNREVRDTVE
jgi:hypothetical protein